MINLFIPYPNALWPLAKKGYSAQRDESGSAVKASAVIF
jgi:hypothetical protein